MKKGMRNFLSIMGALALLAGIGVGVYYGNDKVHSWTDEQISKWKGDNASSSNSSASSKTAETVTSSDGKLSLYLPAGSRFANSSAGATKTVVATLSGNPTDTDVFWFSSDSSKLTVTKQTVSGAAAVITLVAPFDGTATISACAGDNLSTACYVDIVFDNYVDVNGSSGSLSSLSCIGLYDRGYVNCLNAGGDAFVVSGPGYYYSFHSQTAVYHFEPDGIGTVYAVFAVFTATGSMEDLTSLSYTVDDSIFEEAELAGVRGFSASLPANCHLLKCAINDPSKTGVYVDSVENMSGVQCGTVGSFTLKYYSNAFVSASGITADSTSLSF